MVKIGLNEIKQSTPVSVPGMADDIGVPKWISNLESIAKEINKMFAHYYTISGQKPPSATPDNGQNPPVLSDGNAASFSEARAAKKLQMANKSEVINMPDRFKEILAGLIKTTRNLQAMGYGEQTIGQVIAAAPYTVDQIATFLSKLYKKNYGDLNAT